MLFGGSCFQFAGDADMYLAKIRKGQDIHHVLRLSFFDPQRECFRFRDIFDLGIAPARFIDRGQWPAIAYHGDLEEAVALAGAGNQSGLVLERLLWDFFTREEQEELGRFSRRRSVASPPFSSEDEERLQREIHLFDRKRLYFLRYGAVDQTRLHLLHKKLCRPLFGQCRDEREFHFQALERVISPAEYRTYVFAIFDLQRFFSESYSRFMPEALDQERMADHLVEEICHLNDDQGFWGEPMAENALHPHLQRYLVMFFDYGYAPRSFSADFARDFAERHRRFRWPEEKSPPPAEVDAAFGRSMEELRRMSKRDLARLFRKRAKELHPDRGGDHHRFIVLNNLYENLKNRFGKR